MMNLIATKETQTHHLWYANPFLPDTQRAGRVLWQPSDDSTVGQVGRAALG